MYFVESGRNYVTLKIKINKLTDRAIYIDSWIKSILNEKMTPQYSLRSDVWHVDHMGHWTFLGLADRDVGQFGIIRVLVHESRRLPTLQKPEILGAHLQIHPLPARQSHVHHDVVAVRFVLDHHSIHFSSMHCQENFLSVFEAKRVNRLKPMSDDMPCIHTFLKAIIKDNGVFVFLGDTRFAWMICDHPWIESPIFPKGTNFRSNNRPLGKATISWHFKVLNS